MKQVLRVLLAAATGVAAVVTLLMLPSLGRYGPGQYSSLLEWDALVVLGTFMTAGALSFLIARLNPFACGVCVAAPFWTWVAVILLLSSERFDGVVAVLRPVLVLGSLAVAASLGAILARLALRNQRGQTG
jgi:hypothetical protein